MKKTWEKTDTRDEDIPVQFWSFGFSGIVQDLKFFLADRCLTFPRSSCGLLWTPKFCFDRFRTIDDAYRTNGPNDNKGNPEWGYSWVSGRRA